MNKIAFTGTLIFRIVILFAFLFALVLIIIHLQIKLWKQKVIASHLRKKILKKESPLHQLRTCPSKR